MFVCVFYSTISVNFWFSLSATSCGLLGLVLAASQLATQVVLTDTNSHHNNLQANIAFNIHNSMYSRTMSSGSVGLADLSIRRSIGTRCTTTTHYGYHRRDGCRLYTQVGRTSVTNVSTHGPFENHHLLVRTCSMHRCLPTHLHACVAL